MTDFTSKNNTFYTVAQFNATQNQVPARVDESFQFPLLQKADDFTAGVVKAKIDLSTIPLTQANIPLNTYGVQLTSPTGTESGVFFARQLNSNNSNILYNVDQDGVYTTRQYNASTSQVGDTIINTQLAGVTKVFQILIDDQQNLYVAGNNNGSNIYDTLFIFDADGTAQSSISFDDIVSLAISFTGQIFVAEPSQVQVYQAPDMTLTATINTIFPSGPLENVRCVCSDVQTIIGFNLNEFCIYDQAFEPLATFTKPEIAQLGNSSASLGINGANAFAVIDQGTTTDVLWGRTASNQIQNMITNDLVMPAGPAFGCPPVFAGNDNVLVLQNSGQTFVYDYNGDNTLASNPVLFEATPALTWIAEDPISNGPFGNNNTIPTLSQASINPYVDAYQTIDTAFQIQVSPSIEVGQFSFQPNTHKIIATGADLNLYQSSLPIYPRNIFSDGFQYGVSSFEILPSYASNVVTEFDEDPDIRFTYVSSADGNTRVIKDASFQIYTAPNYTAGSTFPIVFPNGETRVLSAVEIGAGGAFAVLGGSNTFFGRYIYIYNDITGALLQTIDLGESCQYAQVASTQNVNGRFLLVTGGVNLSSFSLKTYLSPNLPSALAFTLTTTFSVGAIYYGAKFLGNNFYITQSPALIGAPTQLLRVNFTDLTYTVIVDGTFYQSTPVAFDETVNITGSNALQEIYAKTFASASSILMYNVSSSFTVDVSSLILIPVGSYINAIERLNGLYSWTALTMPTGFVGATFGFAISNSNNNDFYLLQNTTLEVFRSKLDGIVFSTPVSLPFITPATYNQIGCLYGQSSSVIEAKALSYKISDQSPLGVFEFGVGKIIQSVARNNVEGKFYFQEIAPSVQLYQFPPSLTAFDWINDIPNDGFAIFAKNGENIDAGAAEIFDYSVLIQAINDALGLAYLAIGGSSAYIEPPRLTLDYSNGFVTLNYSADYPGVANAIAFNFPLNQLIVFPSVLTNNLYSITLPVGSTSLTQIVKTISAFNQLDKIIIVSNSIFVIGLLQGNNIQNQILSDIDVPTSEEGYLLNIGETLIFQTNFVQAVQLASNLPIQRLNLQLFYQDIRGQQFPLLLNPQTNFSCKLIFMKKF